MPRGKGTDYGAYKAIYEENETVSVKDLAEMAEVTPLAMLLGLHRAKTHMRPRGGQFKNKKAPRKSKMQEFRSFEF